MNKIWTTLLAFVFVTTSAFIGFFPNEADAIVTPKAALIENYSVDKAYITEGETCTFSVDFVDESFEHSIDIDNPYVEVSNSSSFLFDRQNGFLSSTLEYNSDKGGISISIKIQQAWLLSGDTLSFQYGFNQNGKPYENNLSIYIQETNHKVVKEEGRITNYCLTDEDIANAPLSKTTYGKETPNDDRVLDAQRWLNNRYAGKPGYTKIAEDGLTGNGTMMAFVTGLQIDLGIANPTGVFGSQTAAAFTQQIGTLSKGATDSGNKQYVTMIQHAMWCKGYSPGSVTGTFDQNTNDGLANMKSDAGFSGSDGAINAMWMKALLSTDAYVLVNKGDARIRDAQQTLNKNYYAYFGIRPCDGHYSRDTNEALIFAWQCEEGLDVATATGTFGPTTKARTPNLPYDSRYSSANLGRFIRLEQYALYFNQVEGYTKLPFNTTYGLQVIASVKAFQQFMVLPKQDGYTDVGTVMSLLVSTGDPDRSASACDCATQLDSAKAKTLYDAGYRIVGRYLTGASSVGPKNLSLKEFSDISASKMRVFPIYQDGNEKKDHFTYNQGYYDGQIAFQTAQDLYMPAGATVYFAVDYDFMDSELSNSVLPYFQGISASLLKYKNAGGKSYQIGVYGSRNICTRLEKNGLTALSFVSDMSTGYSGNYGVPMPDNWAFDQFHEQVGPGGFAVDKDAVSGKDYGSPFISQAFKYNRTAMKNYATIWWNQQNPEYYEYKTDCANYVSQCLFAGGLPMTESWYSHKTGKELLREEKKDETEASFDVGEPWRLALSQYKYFSNPLFPYIHGEVIKITSAEEMINELTRAASEGNPIQTGDLLIMAEKGRGEEGIHHATIISSVSSTSIKYTAHSTYRFDEPLETHLSTEDCFIIRINDSYGE